MHEASGTCTRLYYIGRPYRFYSVHEASRTSSGKGVRACCRATGRARGQARRGASPSRSKPGRRTSGCPKFRHQPTSHLGLLSSWPGWPHGPYSLDIGGAPSTGCRARVLSSEGCTAAALAGAGVAASARPSQPARRHLWRTAPREWWGGWWRRSSAAAATAAVPGPPDREGGAM
eukprot:scaffold47291_cov35-Phaeocystis_antarctica.AAC.2